MRTKFFFTSLLLLASVSLFAQNDKAVKRYGFQSAIVQMTTDVMGQKVASTVYVDEYGAKECQKTKIEVPGMGEVESALIIKGNETWAVNYSLKSVQAAPLDQPNFVSLSDEMVKKYTIQEVGKEKVLEKDCTVYNMESEAQGMKAKIKVWVYKGFALKQETEISGVKIVAQATEFNEGAMVLPQLFEVPSF